MRAEPNRQLRLRRASSANCTGGMPLEIWYVRVHAVAAGPTRSIRLRGDNLWRFRETSRLSVSISSLQLILTLFVGRQLIEDIAILSRDWRIMRCSNWRVPFSILALWFQFHNGIANRARGRSFIIFSRVMLSLCRAQMRYNFDNCCPCSFYNIFL